MFYAGVYRTRGILDSRHGEAPIYIESDRRSMQTLSRSNLIMSIQNSLSILVPPKLLEIFHSPCRGPACLSLYAIQRLDNSCVL